MAILTVLTARENIIGIAAELIRERDCGRARVERELPLLRDSGNVEEDRCRIIGCCCVSAGHAGRFGALFVESETGSERRSGCEETRRQSDDDKSGEGTQREPPKVSD